MPKPPKREQPNGPHVKSAACMGSVLKLRENWECGYCMYVFPYWLIDHLVCALNTTHLRRPSACADVHVCTSVFVSVFFSCVCLSILCMQIHAHMFAHFFPQLCTHAQPCICRCMHACLGRWADGWVGWGNGWPSRVCGWQDGCVDAWMYNSIALIV